eukprot:jgi/Galph1/3994/GphlegSOOS_G2649.1
METLSLLLVFVLLLFLSYLVFFAYEYRERKKSLLQLIQYKRRTAREGVVDFGIDIVEADRITRQRSLVLIEEVKNRQLSVEQIVRSCCLRSRWASSKTNCVTNELFLESILEAKSLDRHLQDTGQVKGPLHGLTFSVKDNIDIRGSDSSMGLVCRCFRPAENDACIVAALKAAGAVAICKTNVPTTLLTPYETCNPIFGETRNPWNLGRVCGGSSGGAAVLAKLYGASFHLGTDIGGSLRAPAHFCGVCSLKPTNGRLPCRGESSINPGQLGLESTVGFMANKVETMALILKTCSDSRYWNITVDRGLSAPLAFNEEVYKSTNMLRIGMILDDGWFHIHPSVERAVRETAKALRSKGHRVIDWELPVNQWEIVSIFSSVMTSDGLELIRRALEGVDPSSLSASLLTDSSYPSFFGSNRWKTSQKKERFLSDMLLLASVPSFLRRILAFLFEHLFGYRRQAHILRSFGSCTQALDLERIVARQRRLREDFVDAMCRDRLDAIILPVSAIPAGIPSSGFRLLSAFSYCFLCNVLNLPAGVVPVTLVRQEEGQAAWLSPCKDLLDKLVQDCVTGDGGCEGLPVGIQVVSTPWKEEMCLRVMKEIEQVAEFNAEPQLLSDFDMYQEGTIRRETKQNEERIFVDETTPLKSFDSV